MAFARRNLLRIDDMLAAIDTVELLLRERGGRVDPADRIGAFALERGLEIVSEASRRIDPDLKATEPGIAWLQIAGMGNILRHDYDKVDFAVVLRAAIEDLPPLREALLRMRVRAET